MSRLQTPGGGDCYSANGIIGEYDPATPERLLIHADVSYAGAKTNMHQWWVTTTPWEAGSRLPETTFGQYDGTRCSRPLTRRSERVGMWDFRRVGRDRKTGLTYRLHLHD
ncbi:MAG: hypothetical protein ACOC7K_02335 [bacterium]